MFRLSDYDFEYLEKDYVAFMDVVKKFLTMIHEICEDETPYECVMLDKAENLALEYIEMRQAKAQYHSMYIPTNLAEFVKECETYLGYNAICEAGVDDADKYDDTLWNIYGDLT